MSNTPVFNGAVDLDIDELERKAVAAIGQHRWRVYRCDRADDTEACGIKAKPLVSEDDDAGQRGVVYDTAYDECHHHMSRAEAEHIAASDPAAVLALIAVIRMYERTLRQLGKEPT